MAEPEEPGTTNARRHDLPSDELQSAEYIADLTSELAKMARRSRHQLLAHLLDIASLEARTVAAPAKSRA